MVSAMISVLRQLPRNSSTIAAVRPAAISASTTTPLTAALTNTDWSNSGVTLMSSGSSLRARAAAAPAGWRRCRASRRRRSSAPTAARRARRPGARRWSAARSRRAPGRRRAGRSSLPPIVRTGRSFSPLIASGEPFMRTVYSVSPNLAVPDGRIRFCVLTALTTSAGDRPRACSACMSRSTEISAVLAAVRERDGDAGDRDELRPQLVDRGVEHRLLGQRRARQAELDHRDARRRVLDDRAAA